MHSALGVCATILERIVVQDETNCLIFSYYTYISAYLSMQSLCQTV